MPNNSDPTKELPEEASLVDSWLDEDGDPNRLIRLTGGDLCIQWFRATRQDWMTYFSDEFTVIARRHAELAAEVERLKTELNLASICASGMSEAIDRIRAILDSEGSDPAERLTRIREAMEE